MITNWCISAESDPWKATYEGFYDILRYVFAYIIKLIYWPYGHVKDRKTHLSFIAAAQAIHYYFCELGLKPSKNVRIDSIEWLCQIYSKCLQCVC